MPLRSRRSDNIRNNSPDNLVVKLPKCQLLLERCELGTEKSEVKSTVKKRRTGKNDMNRKSRRLLGESPQADNVASSFSEDGDSDLIECLRNVSKKTKRPIRRKQSSTDEIVSSTKKSKKSDDRLEAENDDKKNRADINESRKTREVETHEHLSMDQFKHVCNVFYECLYCDQKYHKLDQIKEHVRSHFPDCLTS